MPPEHIVENWTHEKLNLMIEKLTERKQRERGEKPEETLPDAASFAGLTDKIKVIKQSED